MAQELEILEILAELIIVLVSVTIPTYAIAISLLGPEYSKMVKKVTEEKESLERALQEKAGTGQFKLEDLEAQIKIFHDKEQKLRSRFNPLSLYPTIIFPNIFFGSALVCVLMGIYDFSVQSFGYWCAASVILIAIGLAELAYSLSMIQESACQS